MFLAEISCTKAAFQLQIQFSFDQPQIIALCGPSGSGKTTLLRALAGLEKKVSGHISIGQQIWLNRTQNLPPFKRNIGYVFQEGALFPHLSVLGNLNYALQRASNKKHRYQQKQVIDWLGLTDLLQNFPDQLSGGQKRRAAIARALLSYPELLLLDEPLNGLDWEVAQTLLRHIRTAIHKAQIPTLYTTHTDAELVIIAQRLLYLAQGKIIFDGPLATALHCPSLPYIHRQEAYSLLPAQFIAYNAQQMLSYLHNSLGTWCVPVCLTPSDPSTPTQLRLKIPVTAILLSRTAPQVNSNSAQNLFYLSILAIRTMNQGVCDITVGTTADTLIARVTQEAATAMQLTVGDGIYLQIKAVALSIIA